METNISSGLAKTSISTFLSNLIRLKHTIILPGILILLLVQPYKALSSACLPDTASHQKTDTAQGKPTPYNPSPSDKTGRTLEDTGGNSGTVGKVDTANTLNPSAGSPSVNDRTSNNRYFNIGAMILIALVVAALIFRGRKRKN